MTEPSNQKAANDSLLIPNPVNLDRPIQELQIAFKGLPWLERSFGRSWLSYKANPINANRPIYYPEVFQGLNKDLLNVAPGNDNLKSYSFFKVHEPGEILGFEQNGYQNMIYTVSVIFWFDLLKIDPSKNYDFTEELKADILRIISNHTFSAQSNISILRIWETADKVFEGYTINTIEKQKLVYPRRGIRFECRLGHLEDCT